MELSRSNPVLSLQSIARSRRKSRFKRKLWNFHYISESSYHNNVTIRFAKIRKYIIIQLTEMMPKRSLSRTESEILDFMSGLRGCCRALGTFFFFFSREGGLDFRMYSYCHIKHWEFCVLHIHGHDSSFYDRGLARAKIVNHARPIWLSWLSALPYPAMALKLRQGTI